MIFQRMNSESTSQGDFPPMGYGGRVLSGVIIFFWQASEYNGRTPTPARVGHRTLGSFPQICLQPQLLYLQKEANDICLAWLSKELWGNITKIMGAGVTVPFCCFFCCFVLCFLVCIWPLLFYSHCYLAPGWYYLIFSCFARL